MAILNRFTGCELQQRYVLAVMLFFSLVVSLSLRHNLPIVLTQMVNVPNVSNKTDTVDVSFCPIQNTTNFLGTSLEISTNTSAAAEQLQNVTVFVHKILWTVQDQTSHNSFNAHRQQISGRNGRPRFQWSQKLQGIILSSVGYTFRTIQSSSRSWYFFFSLQVLLGLRALAVAGRCFGTEIRR